MPDGEELKASGRVGKGATGEVRMFSNSYGSRKCALKRLDWSSVEIGSIGDRTNLYYASRANICDKIIRTLFTMVTNDDIVQIMELGDGTANKAALDKIIKPEVFKQFCNDIFQCLISNDLIFADCKLENIVYGINENTNRSMFRIIDIDGILPSEMSTAHNEALRIDFVSATYPILPSELILCPTINVLQTWYAFFVAVTAYCLAYIDGDVATIGDIYWRNCEFPRDKITKFGEILYDEHPAITMLKPFAIVGKNHEFMDLYKTIKSMQYFLERWEYKDKLITCKDIQRLNFDRVPEKDLHMVASMKKLVYAGLSNLAVQSYFFNSSVYDQ